MMIRRLLHCSIVVSSILVALPAAAQQYGAICGSVSDQNASALPGSTVTLSGVGAERVTVADDRG